MIFIKKKYQNLFFVFIFILTDQISKYIALIMLTLHKEIYISSFFSFNLAYNTGIAYGMAQNIGSHNFIIINSLLLTFILYLFRRNLHIGYLLVIAGAAGNIIDRIIYNHVIDFISIDFIITQFICNIADIQIFFGALLILYYDYKSSCIKT